MNPRNALVPEPLVKSAPEIPICPQSMNQPTEFVIRPNSAYNAKTWPWVFALLVLICVGIAARFAWLGYWMILPFAILDVTAVGLILFLLGRQGSYVEKISIRDDEVVIEHLQRGSERRWRFPLDWTRVELAGAGHHWYNRRLLIGSSGKWVEVGQCLTDAERESLADALKREIRNHLAANPG